MSKLLSEEIVEAVTLGDKEGFMSAFHSALAAKVSDALEIKKVEIASTLVAPASNEVVEEEVEQIDELKKSTLGKYIKKSAEDKADRQSYGDYPDYSRDYEDNERRLNKRTKGIDTAVNKLAKEEVEQVDEATPEAKGQSRAEWRMSTPDVIAKNNAKIADRKARAKKKLMSMSIPAGKGK
jgi:hypothetical protein